MTGLPKWAYEIALTTCVFTFGYVLGIVAGAQQQNEQWRDILQQNVAQQLFSNDMSDMGFGDEWR